MDSTGKVIKLLSERQENFILIGDFNAEESDTITIKDFCDIYSFKNLMKDATCLKNPDKPQCIDLMLTNRNRSFQNSCVIVTGLSDFHKMTVTIIRSHLSRLGPKINLCRLGPKINLYRLGPKINHCRDYKNFQMMHLGLSLLQKIGIYKITMILIRSQPNVKMF